MPEVSVFFEVELVGDGERVTVNADGDTWFENGYVSDELLTAYLERRPAMIALAQDKPKPAAAKKK